MAIVSHAVSMAMAIVSHLLLCAISVGGLLNAGNITNTTPVASNSHNYSGSSDTSVRPGRVRRDFSPVSWNEVTDKGLKSYRYGFPPGTTFGDLMPSRFIKRVNFTEEPPKDQTYVGLYNEMYNRADKDLNKMYRFLFHFHKDEEWKIAHQKAGRHIFAGFGPPKKKEKVNPDVQWFSKDQMVSYLKDRW